MTNGNTKFTLEPKNSGDPLRSADWNAAMQEIVRLETAKINREGAESLQGPLTIAEALTVSAIAPPTSTPLEIRGALKLAEGVAVNQFSTDESLGDNSDSIIPTQKAVKTYIDTAVKNSVDTGNQSAVVRGMIMMWSGQANQIPNGWALCDGQNGTPDLRDRFIVGAGSKYTVNVIGGEEFHRLTTDEMPSHDHSNGSFGYFLQVTGERTYSGGSDSSPNEPDLFTGGWNKTVGGNQAHENRPPFYALAFIMKL